MLKLIIRLAYFIVVLIEALVITRIVLIIIDASSKNAFANWVLRTSSMFIDPFEGIVTSSVQMGNFTLPLTPLIALVFYIIAGFVLSELLKSFSRD